VTSIWRRVVFAYLARLQRGHLVLRDPDGRKHAFGGSFPGGTAAIDVHDEAFFKQAALGGEIGFGEAYTQGLWTSPDLVAVFSVFLANQDQSPGSTLHLPGFLDGLLKRALGFRSRRNTLRGSKDNIQAHYDLSNGLFCRFLDPSMTYSCAVFADGPGRALEPAQKNKLAMIADKAGLKPGDHVLEIGCGWGSFIQEAVTRGCRVTGLTLSENQAAWVRDMLRDKKLEDKARVSIQDYREVEQTFDAVVSIEMLEAVGHEYHPDFFRAVDRALKPGGRAVIQVITINDQRYPAYRWEGDWIRKYIFPGGLLPCLARISEVLQRHTTLNISHVEAIGHHYATTLALWRQRFLEKAGELEGLGFDTRFQRMWTYYLAICEAGFRSGHINDLQIVLERPGWMDYGR
jgi:cyclopropane-fatty-acyl-phospholipid synthase